MAEPTIKFETHTPHMIETLSLCVSCNETYYVSDDGASFLFCPKCMAKIKDVG